LRVPSLFCTHSEMVIKWTDDDSSLISILVAQLTVTARHTGKDGINIIIFMLLRKEKSVSVITTLESKMENIRMRDTFSFPA
jgi:hypothetical protein